MNQDVLDIACSALNKFKTIAVVGFSRKPDRTSREIASLLKKNGYNVIGINPTFGDSKAGDIPVYKSLEDVPEKINIVDVFRKSEDIPGIMESVLKVNPDVLWLQQGIRNDEAIKPAKEEGITVIQDFCIAVAHSLCKNGN